MSITTTRTAISVRARVTTTGTGRTGDAFPGNPAWRPPMR